MAAAASSSRTQLPTTATTTSESHISAAAQALLEAHRQRIRAIQPSHDAVPSSSPSHQQTHLSLLEQHVASIERVALQLENLTVMDQCNGDRTIMQPLGPLAFWPATVADHHHVYVRHPTHADSSSRAVRNAKVPALTQLHQPANDAFSFDARDEKLHRHTVSYKRKPIAHALSQLQSDVAAKRERVASLRGKLAELTTETVRQKLREAFRDVDGFDDVAPGSKEGIVVNEHNQVLGEEGLPFFEPMEPVPDSPLLQAIDATTAAAAAVKRKGKGSTKSQPGAKDVFAAAAPMPSRPPGVILPFRRSSEERERTKEQRRKWMDEIFGKLEKEEAQQPHESDDGDDEQDDGEGNDDQDGGAERSAMRAPFEERSSSKNGHEEASSPRSPTSENRVVLRQPTPTPPESPTASSHPPPVPEMSSATRPPPPKSALKQNPERPAMPQRPSFGSTGIRRGFLNLNPSSPGAIRANFAAEDLDEGVEARQGRSSVPVSTPIAPLAKTVVGQAAGVTADSSANASGTSTPSKKTVRIQSPERLRQPSSLSASISATGQAGQDGGGGDDESLSALQRALREVKKVNEKNVNRGSVATAEKRHADDVGVEEEAARIVDLLGPGIVEGHPGAPAKDVLDQLQRAHDEDKRAQTAEAVAQREKRDEEERERERKRLLAEKPALGQTVVERQPSSSRVSATPAGNDFQKAKQSAFKRGFLNQRPSFVPVNPPRATRRASTASGSNLTANTAATTAKQQAPPTQSLGMSALNRASLGDEDFSKRRERMGLPPVVPHARPSKAYAAKMEKRRQGAEAEAEVDQEGNAQEETLLARPVADDDEPREGRVRFAPSAASSGDDNKSTANDAAAVVDDDEARANEINPSARHHVAGGEEEVDEVEDEVPIIRGEGVDSDSDDGGRASSEVNGKQRASASFRDRHDDDKVEDDDDDDDDYDEAAYDTDDLMDLEPDMDYDIGAAFDDSELMKEYAKAKAVLQELGLAPGGSGAWASAPRAPAGASDDEEGGEDEDEDEDEDDYEDDIVPLDATVEDKEYQGNTTDASRSKPKVSRFKAELSFRSARAQRQLSQAASADEAGHQLVHLLSNAHNIGSQPSSSSFSSSASSAAFTLDGMKVPPPGDEGGPEGGPIMVIPQLEPIRFAKDGDLIEGKRRPGPVELVGESSDEEDVKAEMNMRSRLERSQWKRDHPEEDRMWTEKRKVERGVESGLKPPSIKASSTSAKVVQGKKEREADEVTTMMTPAAAPQQGASQVGAAAAAGAAPEGGEGGEEQPQPQPPKKVSRFKAARMAA